jgi:hypothetical protein
VIAPLPRVAEAVQPAPPAVIIDLKTVRNDAASLPIENPPPVALVPAGQFAVADEICPAPVMVLPAALAVTTGPNPFFLCFFLARAGVAERASPTAISRTRQRTTRVLAFSLRDTGST